MSLEEIIEKVIDAKKLLLEIDSDMRCTDDDTLSEEEYRVLNLYLEDAYKELTDFKEKLKEIQEIKGEN